jgi:hypothetical protein
MLTSNNLLEAKSLKDLKTRLIKLSTQFLNRLPKILTNSLKGLIPERMNSIFQVTTSEILP